MEWTRPASADGPISIISGRLPENGGHCSCEAESWTSAHGEIVALRVSGEVDVITLPLLRAAIAVAFDRQPGHLVVDLAGVTFCCVRGFALLQDTARRAISQDIGYALSGLPSRFERHFTMLWGGDRPARYPSVAAAVTDIRAGLIEQAG